MQQKNIMGNLDFTSPVESLNTARRALAGCRYSNSSLAFGGYDGTDTVTGATEEYNGSTWTSSPGSLNTARNALAGAGTQTAALAFGGTTGPLNLHSNRRI
jgi:hypothetical protein